MVHELTDTSFNAFLQSEKPVIVDFYATWCQPCKRLSPLLEEIADEYRDQIAVGKLDTDLNPEITSQYGIMSIPTILVLQNGQVVDQLVGLRPKQDLVQKFGLSAF